MVATDPHGIPDDRPTLWRSIGITVALLALLAPAAWRLFSEPIRDDIPIEPDAVVLRYMAWGNKEQLEVERDVIRRFNDRCRARGEPYRVKLFMPPAGGYGQKLRVMLASDSAPDVIRVDHYDFPSLVSRNHFLDLTDMAGADPEFNPGDFHPAAMKENYHNGRLYGLNVLFGGVVCYYNKDLFARAGLRDPHELWKEGSWTWEAFERSAIAMTERDAAGRPVRYGFVVPGFGMGGPPHWTWALWIWKEGGELLSPPAPNAPRRCLMDSPEAIRGIQSLHDLRFRLGVSPTPADAQTSALTFASGKIAMEFSFAGQAPTYRNVRDFQWDVVPTPYVPGRPEGLVKGNQLVIWRGCKHPRAAWEWVKYMTSRQTELYLYGDQHRRNVPTRRALLQRDPIGGTGGEFLIARQPPFQVEVFPFLLDNGRELPIDYAWPAWTAEAARFMDRLFQSERATAAEVMPACAAAVNRALEREFVRYRAGQPAD